MKIYKDGATAAISFPLGGIGTGSIGLSGNGRLIDWEICNRPDRGSINPFTNFAVKAEDESRVVDFRFLQGDTQSDFMGGQHSGNQSWGYGHGPNRGTMAGMRHFRHTEFLGDFPFGGLRYADPRFPGRMQLTAFNPFIPSNARDSSIPAALFCFSVTNTADKPLRYTVGLSVGNPFPTYGCHEFHREKGVSMLTMHSGVEDRSRCGYGNLTLATDCSSAGHQDYWYRGSWFDDLTVFLNDFGTYGPLKSRRYDTPAKDKADISTLTASLELAPGETGQLRFVISWFVPNYHRYWGEQKTPEDHPDWQNYYAKCFESSCEAAVYCLNSWQRLYGDTRLFRDALTASELPACVLDAIGGNLATLRSTTCLRLTEGDFYGWEGVNATAGSCFGTCQHVWNYAYALPFLFPELERGIRENELRYSLEPCGRMHFRTVLPLGDGPWNFRSCVDGQMGTVMKIYREWKLSGDTGWLRKYWPAVKSMVEFAWSPENEDRWDPDRTGVMTGRQHHTLDVELFGANSWLTGFYHGALLAGAEMARAMGEPGTADAWTELYRRGCAWLEAHTFNGEYYEQAANIKDRSVLEAYGERPGEPPARDRYWDEESEEIKYQIGSGCEIDQVLADWHASLIGLPPIFDPRHRISALKSIYRYNFICMEELNNPCRVFALDGESGVTMCAWKDRREKPAIPIPYSEEVMTGFEYAYAGSLLQCGMEQEALAVISAVRDRYDGKKRNPFSEIECGASYARAMASYSLLLIYSGFRYDMTRGMLGFRPIRPGRYFWSADGAWGTADIRQAQAVLTLLYGRVHIRRFEHSLNAVQEVFLNGTAVAFTAEPGCVCLDISLSAGEVLTLKA